MSNTRLIIKNTIALYVRSFISLILSLLTARQVLANLGIEDYGVYNAVGGVVSMVAFIQGSMAGATQRFLSYYIGLGDSQRLKEVFSMSVNVHLIISIVLVIAIELFGLWYLPNKMNYGTVDYSVVALIFHTSVISLFFMFNSIPFDSMLIAKESMTSFAYIDILQRFLKFGLAYSLVFFTVTKRLSIYASVVLVISFIVFLVYYLTCRHKFNESHYILFWDTKLFKDLFAFTGWVSLPAIVSIFKTQGMVVVLNSTFGPLLNAAQGIANQINNAVKSLANNVGVAFAPQITISYAKKEYDSMSRLFILGSKINFFLFAFISIPLSIEMDFVLSIWLKEVPPLASTIAILILVDTLITNMTSCYNTAIRATGNIKYYELTYNLMHLLGIAIIILIVKIGCEYYMPYIILIIISFVMMFWQFYCMKRVMPFISIKDILLSILQMVLVIITTTPVVYFLSKLPGISGWTELFLVVLSSTLLLSLMIYCVGLSREEKYKALSIIKQKLHFRTKG
jgi:O-antigen/teichoic acid export membrane protein